MEFRNFLPEKADFDFMEFCNVKEWMIELCKGKEHCKRFNNATSIVQFLNIIKGLELLIGCWSHVQ